MSQKWITPQGNRSDSDLGYAPPKQTRVDPAAEWRERAEKAEAQVQAVREFCAATNPIRGELHMATLHGWDTAMEMVLQLLESGEIKGFAFRIANLEGRVDE